MTQLTAVLVCLAPFSAWGKAFHEGDVIPQDVVEQWPEGTLATRIERGYVKQDFKPVVSEVPKVEEEDKRLGEWDLTDAELEGMTKAKLAEFAKTCFDEDLDPDKLTKADLMLEVATMVATKREELLAKQQ